MFQCTCRCNRRACCNISELFVRIMITCPDGTLLDRVIDCCCSVTGRLDDRVLAGR